VQPEHCRECGARLPAERSCRDSFHALLALEWEIPGGAGPLAHFYAVSSYILQHPDSMSYTAESLAWLRSAVASALGGTVSTEVLRRAAQEDGKGSGHVTRRAGDTVPRWPVTGWEMTVEDALAGGATGYGDRAERWARSVVTGLDAAHA
jgi:hypothetical protein